MRFITAVVVSIITLMSLSFAQPDQKLNLLGDGGWDKPERFTVTDRIWPAAHGEADVCLYEDDAMAGMCFSIDDNYAKEHDWWLATFDRYGWDMTWFMIVAYVEDGSQKEFHGDFDSWQRIEDSRHDVSSHTYTHGHCNDPSSGYSTIGCPEILTGGNCCDPDTEYAKAQTVIRETFPGNECWTMAYSGHTFYGQTAIVAGTTFTYDSYAHDFDIARKYYIGCRGTGGRPNIPNRTNYMNFGVGGLGADWVDHLLVKTSEPLYWRGWGSPFWHGHGDTTSLLQHFDYIKAKESEGELWVASVEQMLKYTQSWVTRELTMLDVTDSMVAFTLSDSMRDTVFNYPLTVKVRVNNDWDTVLAYQAGQPVEAVLISHESNKYALVKAVPDGGEVQMTKGTGTVVTSVKTPVISPDGGTHTGQVSVTITSATPGATIHYTTDGTDPDSTSTEYSTAVSVTQSVTLKAIGIMGGKENSGIASAAFTILVDTVAPSLVSAVAADDEDLITLVFNEAIDATDAETAGNYTVPGLTVQSATLEADNMTVSLTVTAMTVDQEYTVTVASISDRAASPNTATGLEVTFTYTESQALEGQTAYWSMNSLDGSTVADEIGSNDATAINLDWTANGYAGGALQFSGYDTLDVGTGDFGSDASHEVTISMWFKADAVEGYLIQKGPHVFPYHMQFINSKIRPIVRTGGTNYLSGTTTVEAGTWYHAVLTVDSTAATLYLDGQEETAYALTEPLGSGNGQYTYIGVGFSGMIDEVRIWDRALNAIEVGDLFAYNPVSSVRLPAAPVRLQVTPSTPVYFNTRGERVPDITGHSGMFLRYDGISIEKVMIIK